jgi:hypothetical protein
MKSTVDFIKKEFILFLIIFFVFINPFFYGYRVAMIFFIFLFFKIKFLLKNMDSNVICLFLFGFLYEILSSFNNNDLNRDVFSILPNIFVPSLLYIVGKYISVKYNNKQIWLFFLFFLTFAFSLIPMVSILLQIIENDFITGTRSLYLIWDKNNEISATGLGSYFVLNMAAIGLMNLKRCTRTEHRIFVGIILLFLLSLMCVIRLGSRTQLIIAVISVLVTYFYNYRANSFIKNFSVLFFSILGLYYLLGNFNTEADWFTFYADRLNENESGFGTAGGRTERWWGSFQSIFTDPFGWEFSRYGYAHNLWLDTARVAGILPLFFLLFFTLSAIKIFTLSLTKLNDNLFFKNYVLVYFLAFFLIFNVEPVLEGMYLLFLLFCLFVGFLKGIVTK